MARINRLALEGVSPRELSRHLRNNGCKVTTDEATGLLLVRSDKSVDQLKQLASQLPGCSVFIEPNIRA